VQVYGGCDGTFEMVEDDGATKDYLTSTVSATRTILFVWTEATKTLT
jgi:hypothetical protein